MPPQPLKERKTSLPGALIEADSEVLPPYAASIISTSPGTSVAAAAALGRVQELPEPSTQRDNRAIDNT